ncbi:hypothetical protein FACS1894216_22650 [Synergistales bacterium]|nr:hypothetical protein FACS1894216_22650 [Synergistales bacterium]
MIFTRSDGTSSLVLQPGRKILRRHIEYVISEEPASDIIGEVAQNPKDASMWGVKNLSGADWSFTNAHGETRSVPSGRSVPVFPSNLIAFPNGASASFQA